MVHAILQDRRGFLWFGTMDGLNRYDGYQFTVFRNDPFDSTSISSNIIYALFENRDGLLWISTNNGLNVYDPQLERFRRFMHDTRDSLSLSGNAVLRICETPAPLLPKGVRSILWIATVTEGLNQLVMLDGSGLHEPPPGAHEANTSGSGNDSRLSGLRRDHYFIRHQHNPTDPASLASNEVRDVLIDRNGTLWIATRGGLDWLDLKSYLSDNRRIEEPADFGHKFTHGDKAGISFTGLFSLHEDSDGLLWVGTDRGLVRIVPSDRAAADLLQYEIQQEHFMKSTARLVSEICEDISGRLWLATYWGLATFDKGAGTFQWAGSQSNGPAGTGHHTVLAVHLDQSDNLWVGTNGYGLNQYDLKMKQFHLLNPSRSELPLPKPFSVNAMSEDGEGNVWFAASNMVYRFDWRTGSRLEPSPRGFKAYQVNAMFKDHAGTLWIANDLGVHRYLPGAGQVEKFFPEADDQNFMAQAVCEDRTGDVWFGGQFGDKNYPATLSSITRMLYRWHRQSGLMSAYSIALPAEMRDSQLELRGMHQDSSGVFWLATNFGLLRFDPASGVAMAFGVDESSPNRLTSRDIKSVLADPIMPDRFLWLGTNGGGLNRFDCTTDEFLAYTQRHGLPNHVVYGVLPDGDGKLWLSTNKGLAIATLTVDTREIIGFRNYDVQDGLQSNEFNTASYCRAASGELFFGGVNGLNYFHPDSIKDNPFPPPVVITDFQIRHRSIRHDDNDSPLSRPIAFSDAVTVSYADNVLTFEFAALDYSAPQKNLYSYKLEGFESEWSAPSRERRATYTNLDPGEYTFHVRGSNNDGVWNDEGAAIKLIVTPPWWKTWWAYSLYATFFFSLVYLLRKYEKNRQALRHKLELEYVEAEKLQELDRLKSRFFANISHEFRTPLTLVLGDVESSLLEQKAGQSKRRLQRAFRNGKRLLRLINQLLDLSKLEAGGMKLNARLGNILSLLKNITYSFESLAKQKNIALRFKSADEEIMIMYEDEKIEKIMSNLLSNAFKFTPAGGRVSVEVAIHNQTESKAAPAVEIKVCDTGSGIPKTELPHIFDRFYQVDSTRTRSQEGTGIGLALTKELVELHRGEMMVESEEGVGTTFTVRLPIVSDYEQVATARLPDDQDTASASSQSLIDPALQPPVLQRPATSDQQLTSSNREIILVVEDNADVRAYICEHLEEKYRVISSSNGEEAVAMALEVIPDLIITDVMMPKMDGYQLAIMLRQDEKTSHIPIIMLTAKAGESDKLEGLETGVDAFLIKPFNSQELRVRVRKLIEMRKKLRARFSTATIIKPSEIEATSLDRSFLNRVIAVIEKRMGDDDFDVATLAHEAAMSVSQINRKLSALIGQPAGHLIRSMRLQRAADLLVLQAGTVSEIAHRVGFYDQSHFARHFKKQFGCAPTAYRRNNPPQLEKPTKPGSANDSEEAG